MSFETIIVSVALITVSTASYFLQASILEEIIFEDIKVSVLKEYDKYLTKLYGNYMKYPPLDKQVGHHYNKGLSLTEGYKDYIKRNRI